jgi:hypothetical protein
MGSVKELELRCTVGVMMEDAKKGAVVQNMKLIVS